MKDNCSKCPRVATKQGSIICLGCMGPTNNFEDIKHILNIDTGDDFQSMDRVVDTVKISWWKRVLRWFRRDKEIVGIDRDDVPWPDLRDQSDIDASNKKRIDYKVHPKQEKLDYKAKYKLRDLK